MRLESRNNHPLGKCHGYVVLANDGWLGHVETPLFASDSSKPNYLVVRAQADRVDRRTVLPASLVRRVDVDDRLVFVRGNVCELVRLPSSMPAAPEPRRRN